jgi:hypothetical protein
LIKQKQTRYHRFLLYVNMFTKNKQDIHKKTLTAIN